MKKYLFLLVVLSGFLTFCSQETPKAEEQVNKPEESSSAIRKGGLYSENVDLGKMSEYSTQVSGEGVVIERAFENAPPMIPHTVTGQFPITKELNLCLSCHMPDVAEKLNATPMPTSHFKNYRPKHEIKNGKYNSNAETNEVVSEDCDKMYLGRYNCSQCHVPQMEIDVAIQNTFEANFRNIKQASSSDLDETIKEGM